MVSELLILPPRMPCYSWSKKKKKKKKKITDAFTRKLGKKKNIN